MLNDLSLVVIRKINNVINLLKSDLIGHLQYEKNRIV